MQRLLLAAGLALAIVHTAAANELIRVFELAERNDPTMQAARYAREAALEARPQARAALLPQINASAFETRGTTTNTFTANQDGTPRSQSIDSDAKSDGWSATLSLPVYDHALWLRLAQSGDSVAAAQARYRAAEQDLAVRTARAYFDVLAAQDSLRFAEAEKKAVSRQLEQARKRFEVGLSAITDVHEAQARYDLTVSQQLEADQQLRNARDALQEITGQPVERFAPLQEQIPLRGPDPDDVQAWLDVAREHNLDLIAARFQEKLAERDVRISRAGHYPTLTLNGSYFEQESTQFVFGLGNFPAQAEGDRVTLTLNLPVFSGGLTQSRVRQAHQIHRQREAELTGVLRSVERQVRNAYQGVLTGVARVRALKQAVVSNTTALDASETGLRVGARTAVDVLNAQRELYRAQRDYSRARYDYLLSVLQLKQAAGQLVFKDLLEIDRLLAAAD